MTFLETIYGKFEDRLRHYFADNFWKIKMTVWAVIIVFLSFFNNISPLYHFADYFNDLKNHQEYFGYKEIRDRTLDWKKNWVYPPMTGLNNRTFRLAMPFLLRFSIFILLRFGCILFN